MSHSDRANDGMVSTDDRVIVSLADSNMLLTGDVTMAGGRVLEFGRFRIDSDNYARDVQEGEVLGRVGEIRAV